MRAHELEPRERLVVEPQHQERLVVLQPDVVRRLVLLDQRVLEQQRLPLRARHDRLDVLRVALEERREPHLVPLDEVREQLRDHIREEKAEQAVKSEIARLREAAEIKILIPLSRQNPN